jgi:hypothetical protein
MTLENLICRAEIAYKKRSYKTAVRYAKSAVLCCEDTSTCTALRIFIARAYSKLGRYAESNAIYRQLVDEKNYLPPVIMGLLYNCLKTKEGAAMPLKKVSRNLGLIKILVRQK